jgi:N-acetyl-anhydromuramyl-L-alanine amidase AmpD
VKPPELAPKAAPSTARNAPRIVSMPAPLAIKDRPAHSHNYSRSARLTTQCIVLHCTEGCEGASKDDDVAAMFADPELEPRRSAHYVVDANSVTRCVPDALTAWHCGKHGNAVGIGIELCGRASQTRAQWFDAASIATLQIAARLVADLCAQHGVPPVMVNDRGLRAGQRGVTTHALVSLAWCESNHVDPGEGFPLSDFVLAVATTLQR